MTTLAAFLDGERTEARTEERRHPCDLCHVAMGIRFVDWSWVCVDCVQRVRERLIREEWRTTEELRSSHDRSRNSQARHRR